MTDQERADAIAELQALIDVGFASGTSNMTADEVFAEASTTADSMDRQFLDTVKARLVRDRDPTPRMHRG